MYKNQLVLHRLVLRAVFGGLNVADMIFYIYYFVLIGSNHQFRCYASDRTRSQTGADIQPSTVRTDDRPVGSVMAPPSSLMVWRRPATVCSKKAWRWYVCTLFLQNAVGQKRSEQLACFQFPPNSSWSEPLCIFHELWNWLPALKRQLCDTKGRVANGNICGRFASRVPCHSRCMWIVVIRLGRWQLRCFISLKLFSERAGTRTHTQARLGGLFQSLLLFLYRHHQVLQLWTFSTAQENNDCPVLCLDLMTSCHCCGGSWELWNRLYHVKHSVMVLQG